MISAGIVADRADGSRSSGKLRSHHALARSLCGKKKFGWKMTSS
jgi:hypothetical protein